MIKTYYDKEVDALYVQLNDQQPDEVIEIAQGFHIDTTSDGQITGLEILNVSRLKTGLHSLFGSDLDVILNAIQHNSDPL